MRLKDIPVQIGCCIIVIYGNGRHRWVANCYVVEGLKLVRFVLRAEQISEVLVSFRGEARKRMMRSIVDVVNHAACNLDLKSFPSGETLQN